MSPFDSSPHARLSTLLIVLGSLGLLHAKNILHSAPQNDSEGGELTLLDSGQGAGISYLEASTLAPSAFLDDGGAMIDTLAGAPSAVTGMDRFRPVTGFASAGATPALFPAGAASQEFSPFTKGGAFSGSPNTAGDFAGGGGSGYSPRGLQANGGSSRQNPGSSGGSGSSGGGFGGRGTGGSEAAMGSGDGNDGAFGSSLGGPNSTGYIVNSAKLAADDSATAVGVSSSLAVDTPVATDLGDGTTAGVLPLVAASELNNSDQIAGAAAYLGDATSSDQTNLLDAPLVAGVSDAAGTLSLLMLGLGMVAIYGRPVRERRAPG